eukprot:SAG22_NODE_3191_length_1865_cov_1.745753_2_plen_178_part_01
MSTGISMVVATPPALKPPKGGRGETDLQKEKRLLRDGYDVRSIGANESEVFRRLEKSQKATELVERLKEAMAGLKSSPKEFAAFESLIAQVNELKRRDVGPEPARLVRRSRQLLAKRRADFFKSGKRPVTSASSDGGQHRVFGGAPRPSTAGSSFDLSQSFRNQLGAKMQLPARDPFA